MDDLLGNRTLDEFTRQLAEKRPVPGGGGAAALAGALAVSLGNMVGNYTTGKKKYAANEELIQALNQRAEELRIEFLKAIDEDAQAFEPLSKAYAIPKDDPERDEVMEECLRQAVIPPLKIFDLSMEVIEMSRQYVICGSTLMVSDAGCAAALGLAALKAAALNVYVNTKAMKDTGYARQLNDHVKEGLTKAGTIAEETYQGVSERLI